MKYFELKQKHQRQIDNFPMFFAFNRKQFKEGMDKLDVKDTDELYKIGGGGFIRKTDSDALEVLFTEQEDEMQQFMQDRAFMIEAIEYELGNHEYIITYDPTQTVKVLDLNLEDPVHAECFNTARRQYLAYAQG